MAKRVGVDKWLFGVVLLLTLFGLVMVFSASAVVAKSQYGSPYYFVVKEFGFAVAGLVALAVLMQVDYRRYNSPRVVFPAMAVTTLLLVSVFAMHALNNTHRWVKFGVFTFQPSELAKPMSVLFLAYFLQTRIHKMDDWKGTVMRAALPPLVFVGLILKEPDLGTALVCAGVTVAMLYLAGLQMKWIGLAAAAASPVMFYMLWMVKWRRDRLIAFTNPEADPLGKGFHIMQSLIAVGTGGVRGLGLMEGRQKLYYLPEAWTDFIFANISEELGLLGALALVALFVTFGYRGLRAAYLSTDPFARFLAFGLTTAILIQAFFNMSVALALVPTKGITLPFVSFGGTSLFFTLAGMGVLLNITREID
ncbi:putative lipid II flippase FtsW [Granulicella tundricola]|uniref:Probable peptidoglycan glycosyltransferase FtsW n=1 Tax=Granulicella tundricola (strain ATCC BAA-1859 / DSM 23138 / MP5ACTX9) TaxID=1198114 RepID=E8WX93_GRATM|nr:putative lipid II flippase FtsW [Granulicella tundricola]ADW69735.1 cell cycle protein [Granulicella tundricola MP5ACTX9]